MNFPSDLTDKLLEFILDNHTTILVCATSDHGDLRGKERQTLTTGIKNILLDQFEILIRSFHNALEEASSTAPPPLPDPAAVAETVEAIWQSVLGSFDDNVWLDKDERIVFFARWETQFKESTEALLAQLIENR